jgi:hypothetical protein
VLATTIQCRPIISVLDPNCVNANPDSAFLVNANPDADPDQNESGPRVLMTKS